MKPTDAELENRFRYHAPSPEAIRRHAIVSEDTLALAKTLRDIVPESRGLSIALTALEEVRMWANQGIATNHGALDRNDMENFKERVRELVDADINVLKALE